MKETSKSSKIVSSPFQVLTPPRSIRKQKSADYQKSNQHLVIYLLTVFMQPLL